MKPDPKEVGLLRAEGKSFSQIAFICNCSVDEAIEACVADQASVARAAAMIVFGVLSGGALGFLALHWLANP